MATDPKVSKVETITLDDGRKAERHISYDESGNEIVEVFAEEKRPLKLEKRVVREMKEVVAKERHQTVKDGEVVYEEIHSLEPELQMELRSRIGTADHAKVVDGDYVRREDVAKLIEDGVVAGVSTLMQNMEIPQPTKSVMRMQDVVEQNVQESDKKKVNTTTIVLVGILVAQAVGLIAYFCFA